MVHNEQGYRLHLVDWMQQMTCYHKVNKVPLIELINEGKVWKLGIENSKPTLLVMMSTMTNMTITRLAAILSAMSFVDGTTNTMPQKVNPRYVMDHESLSTFPYQLMDNKNELL